ncbi:hypothetical protein PENSPDRAFT_646224 [Peniophora sp. CONT]|nr:hypothetical protein PENSPDRAFT_646224 [Peniophora sp. CONT]
MDTSMSLGARLPDDIVYELYRASAQVDPPRAAGFFDDTLPASTLGWITLTHVCRRWRQLGIDLATLWAQIICAFPPSITTILQRSKIADLTLIICTPNSRRHERRHIGGNWTLEQAAHLLFRAHTLQYHLLGSKRDLHKAWSLFIAHRSLSHLTELHIFARHHSPLRGDPLEVPALRTLTTNVAFLCNAPSLKILKVRGKKWHWRLLLHLLQKYPFLVEFHCQWVIGSADELSDSTSDEETTALQYTYGLLDEREAPSQAVVLMHLETLGLKNPSYWGSGQLELLRYLELPARIPWQIQELPGTDCLVRWLSRAELRYAPRDILSFLDTYDGSAVVQVTLHEGEGPHVGLGYAPKNSIQLCAMPDNVTHQDVPKILSVLGDKVAPFIRILAVQHDCACDGGDGCDGTFAWVDDMSNVATSLKRFTNVTDFHFLRQGENGPARILSLLCAPTSLGGWIFPMLRVLVLDLDRIQTGAWWAQLRTMFIARRTSGRAIERLVVRGSGGCHAIDYSDENISWPWNGKTKAERDERASVFLKDCEITLAEERELVTEVIDERTLSACYCVDDIS